MPLPKSITSLLTAIVVAIPAAITTLALNKPKPPKEIDAVITLDENNEVIDEQEIKPKPAPPPPPEPSESSRPSSGTLLPGGGQSSEDASFSANSETDNGPAITEDEDEEDGSEEEEGASNEEQEKQNEKDEEKEEPKDDTNEQSTEQPDSQKDVIIEELQNSIREIMQKIIDEGSNFNPQNSNLYSLYTIKTSLENLPSLITSWKTKMEQEKNKAATSSGDAGNPPSTKPGGEVSQ